MSLHLLRVRRECRDQTVYGGPWSHLFPTLSFGKPYFRNSKESKTFNSLICHQLMLDIQDLGKKKNSMKIEACSFCWANQCDVEAKNKTTNPEQNNVVQVYNQCMGWRKSFTRDESVRREMDRRHQKTLQLQLKKTLRTFTMDALISTKIKVVTDLAD